MADATFGDSGTGTNFNFSCTSSWWTNWDGTYGMGGIGRIEFIAAHWGYHSTCNSANGHNDLWDTTSPFNRLQYTTDFGPPVGHGTWNNVGLPTAQQANWYNNKSFYIGFWRGSGGSNEFDVHGGSNWAAKNGDDGNISSGTLCPYQGTCGTMGIYGTYFVTQVWVRRSGAWSQLPSYIWRSGAWKQIPGNGSTWVFRSGSWSPIDAFTPFVEGPLTWRPLASYIEAGYEIPAVGLKGIICPVGVPGCDQCEPAYFTEDGERGWFGSCDVSKLGIPWDQQGFHEAAVPEAAFTSVRRNSGQSEEEIEWLSIAKIHRDDLLLMGHDPAKVQYLWERSVEGSMIEGFPMHLSTVQRKPFSSLMGRISEPLSVESALPTSAATPACSSCGSSSTTTA